MPKTPSPVTPDEKTVLRHRIMELEAKLARVPKPGSAVSEKYGSPK